VVVTLADMAAAAQVRIGLVADMAAAARIELVVQLEPAAHGP
jgi:hypothetical protein